MTNMEQQLSEEDLMITKSSISVRDPIPADLLIDIFSRVPSKSIARFRCVSKFWESLLGRQDFMELFMTKSVARPRLFFAVEVNEELLVFSSPQPQDPDETSSLVATPYKAFPKCFPTTYCTPLYGLVFLQNWKRNVGMICNPVTGESITLPKLEATGHGERHFGFDPISKQFKVLCNAWSSYATPKSPRVLTLETRVPLWRPSQDSPLPHCYPGSHEICINGVVYYPANFANTSSKIVCFDFRSERLSLINMDRDMLHRKHFSLFNYKGNLGVYQHTTSWCKYKEDPVSLNQVVLLWVLEDAGKHRWSKRICVLPPRVGDEIVRKNVFVGMTVTGELVFSPKTDYLSNPFHVVYYNIERNTFTRFKIQGFKEFKHARIFVHLDFVENMKFM